MDLTRYTRRVFDTGVNLIVFASSPTSRWRICIPSTKLDQMIHWYHMVLNHVGTIRLYEMMTMHFYHHNLRTRIESTLSSISGKFNRHSNMSSSSIVTEKAYRKVSSSSLAFDENPDWDQHSVDEKCAWCVRVETSTCVEAGGYCILPGERIWSCRRVMQVVPPGSAPRFSANAIKHLQ